MEDARHLRSADFSNLESAWRYIGFHTTTIALEAKIRKEIQLKKKFELVQKLTRLRKE